MKTKTNVCECGHVLRRHVDGKCGGCACNNPTPASDVQAAILTGIETNQRLVREAQQRRGRPFMGAP